MHPAFTRTEHRPWPLPTRPWMWRQSWHHLLFAHWPVSVDAVAPIVPKWLTLQEHSGSTWVGLIPFTMTGVTLRGVPALPVISHFPELNLRLYVTYEGKPGLWFVSLDAARRSAVWAARRFAYLPYFHSTMRVAVAGDTVAYSSVRRGKREVAFAGRYGPAGPIAEARRGSLEHFLTERYCLYTEDADRRRCRLEIHHRSWPLQPADAQFSTNQIAQAQGIRLPETAPILHYSHRLDAVGWGIERLK